MSFGTGGLSRIRAALHEREAAIALSLCAIFALWGPHGRAPFDWGAVFGDGAREPLVRAMIDFAWGALLAVAVPIAVLKAWLHEPLRDYGLGLGDARLGWKVTVVGLAIGAPLAWLSSRDPAMREVYPLFGHRPDLPVATFVAYELAYALFFLAIEFSMRGYLLFGLRRLPPSGAIAVAAIVQTVWHLGAPPGELAIAPVWGVVVGALNLRLRSIWYGFLVHWLINVLLDALLTYG